jgi:hypothetical protein
MSNIEDYPLLVLALSFVGMWFSARIGIFICRKQRNAEEDGGKVFDFVKSAIMTMLALIIGFSFSMAVNRFDQRKNCEEAEANSIGTEYLRADFLPPAEATRVRALLKNYLDQRVLFYRTRDNRQLQQIDAMTAQLETDMWTVVQARLRHARHLWLPLPLLV